MDELSSEQRADLQIVATTSQFQLRLLVSRETKKALNELLVATERCAALANIEKLFAATHLPRILHRLLASAVRASTTSLKTPDFEVSISEIGGRLDRLDFHSFPLVASFVLLSPRRRREWVLASLQQLQALRSNYSSRYLTHHSVLVNLEGGWIKDAVEQLELKQLIDEAELGVLIRIMVLYRVLEVAKETADEMAAFGVLRKLQLLYLGGLH